MQLKAALKSAVACAAIYITLKLCFWFMSPFLLSVFISILIEPLLRTLMERLQINRTISIIAALLFFCSISFFITYFLIHNIYLETLGIIKNAPAIYGAANKILMKYYSFLKNNFNISLDLQNAGKLNGDRAIEELVSIFAFLKNLISKLLYSLPDVIMYITFSLIAAFFISRDREKIMEVIKKILPPSFIRIAVKLNHSVLNMIKTECMLIIISTVETILGFMLLGVDYAVILGVIAGILDILPLVGPGMLFIPWAVYSLINGKYVFALSLIILFIIIAVTRQIMETKLISGRLELHPLIILISIYLGLKFFGILGAALGPLMAMTLKLVYIESMS